MNAIDNNTPIIIGVGEYSERIDDEGYQALSPVQLASMAAIDACNNVSQAVDIKNHIDAIACVRTFEDTSPKLAGPFGKANCFPRAIAKQLGINPAIAVLDVAGGQSPQHLVNEFCERIAKGEVNMALLTGGEAISTTRFLASQQKQADWTITTDNNADDRGPGSEGISSHYMQKHMLFGAPQCYALFENARRASLQQSKQDYAKHMAELFAPFSNIAANNPHSMSKQAYTAEELIDVSENNRFIADPYPRRLVARDQVNQAASVLITNVGKAKELGIDSSAWIFLTGYADAVELSVMEREDLARSPAAAMAIKSALEHAKLDLKDINHFDLYSCFPIAVSNICDQLALKYDDPRGLSSAGGLPFFGGAGNNYSMHAIVSLIKTLRKHPEHSGLIGANGGFLSKYSVGIYSSQARTFKSVNKNGLQEKIDALPRVKVTESPEGSASIETYTVLYHKGVASLAIIIGRLDANNQRFLAMSNKGDAETLKQMIDSDPIAKRIKVNTTEKGNFFSFL